MTNEAMLEKVWKCSNVGMVMGLSGVVILVLLFVIKWVVFANSPDMSIINELFIGICSIIVIPMSIGLGLMIPYMKIRDMGKE